MVEIQTEDKEKIWYLFYDKIKDIEKIVKIMNNKYTYREVKEVVWEKLK